MKDVNISFLISVKHYDNSYCYKETWESLRKTLVSVCAQTQDNFNVVVVSNKTLSTFENENRIKNTKFIEVDWAPTFPKKLWLKGEGEDIDVIPENSNKRNLDNDLIHIDMACKYLVGLCELRKTSRPEDYFMTVDADDFIHKEIVSEVLSDPTPDMYRIVHGIQLGLENSWNWLRPFYKWCGTSRIVRMGILDKELNFECSEKIPSKEMILSKVDNFFLKKIIGDHQKIYKFFSKKGFTVKDLSIAGAAYNCGHNEQSAGTGWQKKLKNQVNKWVLDSFNIDEQ